MLKFAGYDCQIERDRYADNGNTALFLIATGGEDIDEGETLAVCTVNLGDKLPEDQAYIKDYSENEGILQALKDAGVVTSVLNTRRSGWVDIPLCQLDLSTI